MEVHALLAFAAIYVVGCGSPGPTVAALVARVLGRGTQGAVAFCSGLLIGDLIWLGFAVFGLAILAEAFQPVFQAMKYLGAAYLLYLAWKLWTAPAPSGDGVSTAGAEHGRSFLGGLTLALGNVKTMLFFVALVPTVVPLDGVTASGFVTLSATVVVVYGGVMFGYVVLASRARRALSNSRLVRIVNRITGTIMAGAAAAIAARN